MKQIIKKPMLKIREILVYLKFYIHRSSSYLAIINSSMILFILLNTLNIDANLEKYFIIILILGLLALILFGALDIHLFKANQIEQVLNFKYNPAMIELREKIDEINEKLDNLNLKS